MCLTIIDDYLLVTVRSTFRLSGGGEIAPFGDGARFAPPAPAILNLSSEEAMVRELEMSSSLVISGKTGL